MGISEKYKKRVLTFLIIPVLIAIPFFTEDIIFKIIAGIILVVYVGFIIFLRDSTRSESIDNVSDEIEHDFDSSLRVEKERFIPDNDEDFKIISPNKNMEVLTADGTARVPVTAPCILLCPSWKGFRNIWPINIATGKRN